MEKEGKTLLGKLVEVVDTYIVLDSVWMNSGMDSNTSEGFD